jgi:potassium efflux system protein
LSRLRGLWYALAVGMPLALAALTALGYQFTALELLGRLKDTTGLLLGLLLVHAIARRAIVVARRRMRRQRTRDQADVTATTATGAAKTVFESTPLDADVVDTHSRRLLRAFVSLAGLLGAWFIWVDVLPALKMLREVELWSHVVTVIGDADGKTAQIVREVPVTLADLALAVILLVVTVLAARNIPGVLEISVLQRLDVQPASRYAVATVARHLLWIIGIVLALGEIGVGWDKVQWLVAAVGLGLGFGLQEIFGNFVSGLIVLFEHRVRVGDVVTVGDVSGRVTRIRVLATTVQNWEHKEFIVPNKDLVTGRILNWTLSDEVTRIDVPVGVAYGTDTGRARAMLLEIAHDHPDVLADPPPVATFEGFGDSALDLQLRCFTGEIDRRLQTITELHEGIDRAFREAGVEIAFPQRDIHVRSLPAREPSPPEERPARDATSQRGEDT